MRLKALNHCKNNQNFLFIIIITRIFQGFSKKKLYFCRNVWFERGKFGLTKRDGKAFLTTGQEQKVKQIKIR